MSASALPTGGFCPSHAQRLLMRQYSSSESDEWGLVSLKIQRNSVSETRKNSTRLTANGAHSRDAVLVGQSESDLRPGDLGRLSVVTQAQGER